MNDPLHIASNLAKLSKGIEAGAVEDFEAGYGRDAWRGGLTIVSSPFAQATSR